MCVYKMVHICAMKDIDKDHFPVNQVFFRLNHLIPLYDDSVHLAARLDRHIVGHNYHV